MPQTLLNDDLNIIANSDLEIIPLEGDLAIIQKLDDEPNDVGGLTAAQLKAKFDESGLIIQKYINESLIPQVVGSDATEAARNAAEANREEQELLRQHAEQQRELAEAQREANEQQRTDETVGVVAQAAAQVELAKSWAQEAQRAAVEGNHAHRHGLDGEDPLTPAMIGTYSKEEVDRQLETLTPGLLPQIIVTSTPGSVVTCAKEDITLTTQERDGSWLFDVPEYGTWVVSVTYNNHTWTETVLVDVVAQYRVDKSNYLYLPGDECAAVTGGWSAKAFPFSGDSGMTGVVPTVTRNSNSLVGYMGTQLGGGVVRCANTIDLTDVDTLYFTGKFEGGNTSGTPMANYHLMLCVWGTTIGSYWYNTSYIKAKLNTSTYPTSYVEAEIDVSHLSGYHIIGFGMYGRNGRSQGDYTRFTMQKLKME